MCSWHPNTVPFYTRDLSIGDFGVFGGACEWGRTIFCFSNKCPADAEDTGVGFHSGNRCPREHWRDGELAVTRHKALCHHPPHLNLRTTDGSITDWKARNSRLREVTATAGKREGNWPKTRGCGRPPHLPTLHPNHRTAYIKNALYEHLVGPSHRLSICQQNIIT